MDNRSPPWEQISGNITEAAGQREEVQPADSIAAMAAMVFHDTQQPDDILSEFASHLMDQGKRVLGLVQKGHCEGPATRELFVTLLHTGNDVQIFQDLGSCAQGCKLDINQLLRAGASISESLTQGGADILIINRFGKLEKEGKGLLFLVEQALSADIPVLIAVPDLHLDGWMEFSGGLGRQLACDAASLVQWWSDLADREPIRRIA